MPKYLSSVPKVDPPKVEEKPSVTGEREAIEQCMRAMEELTDSQRQFVVDTLKQTRAIARSVEELANEKRRPKSVRFTVLKKDAKGHPIEWIAKEEE
jgi:hypothetical protein